MTGKLTLLRSSREMNILGVWVLMSLRQEMVGDSSLIRYLALKFLRSVVSLLCFSGLEKVLENVLVSGVLDAENEEYCWLRERLLNGR